jgi:hypothetical protein
MPLRSFESDIEKVEAWLGATLPADYVKFLKSHTESIIGEQVCLYSVTSLIERNETYETLAYCPGYLAIGDDSGGRAVIIPLAKPLEDVYLVDHGYMDLDGFKLLPLPFSEWLRSACPVD